MALTGAERVLSPASTGAEWEQLDGPSEAALHELFLARGWTDGLPIVLPTESRVADMLGGTSRPADAVVGRMQASPELPAHEFTVRHVAINAVMAGARAEYLPAILAVASTGISARQSDPSSTAAMVVVNGPIRHELDMNCGIGALGPYNRANSTIGRAYGLLSQNLQGGSVPGVSYFGTQGNNYSFSNTTFAENEERSPWEPFHVAAGCAASDSAVSVFESCRHNTFTLGLRETHWRTHVWRMLVGMDPSEAPLFVLDPIAAHQFVTRGGFADRQALVDWVYEIAQLPAADYWAYRHVQATLAPRARAGEEPYASLLRAAPDEMIHIYPRDTIRIVVVGGETNGYWRLFGARHARTVTVDAWR